AVPCTREKLNEILDSAQVKWKIESIRSLRKPDAIKQWAKNADYQKFCIKESQKKRTGEAFRQLTDEEKLKRFANTLKESLPALIFGARDFDETPTKKDPEKLMKRRLLAAIHLSGLFMFDVDHVENPKEIFEQGLLQGVLVNEELRMNNEESSSAETGPHTPPTDTSRPSPFGEGIGGEASWEVVFAHLTSSGSGLRLVCKVRPEVGNIADNQIELAKALGVKADASCIDASRISYVPMREDVYYLNEDELITYYNKEFDEKWCKIYRGSLTPDPSPKGEGSSMIKGRNNKEMNDKNGEKNEKEKFRGDGKGESGGILPSSTSRPSPLGEGTGGEAYHGIPYSEICEAWQAAHGGAPAPGDRHRTMLQLALDLRYITDNNPESVYRLLSQCGFVQDVIRERGEGEVRDIADSACSRKLYQNIPKRLEAVLESLGVGSSESTGAAKAVAKTEIPYEQFAERLEPLLCAPYAEAARGVTRYNKLGAVYAAGAMYCTLLTRCWYKHFDDSMQRMNPQVLIIGYPASGKSFAKALDDQIMASMRAQDQEVRLAETRYKTEQKKRGTSSKAQKADALVEPEGMIRYLPTKTSNNIFFRRLKRAKEEVNGEVMPLHLYMFDSELDSSISAQSGGAWIGKHDLELKAFHNELSGVDYANNDSINDILPVYWNSVTTGTTVSLHKKFTLRNINDGLCSRVAIFQMERNQFKMVRKHNMDWQANERMKQWGFKFEQLHGELPLERLVDHVYTLCEMSAEEAEAANDLVLDYLRKRAVFYATWFTVPRILAREYDTFKKTGMLTVTDDDLKFATLMYDTVIYFQDHFFGQMLQDSWENAEREYVPRRRNTKNADAYRDLPETFTTKDVMAILDLEDTTARQQCKRWVKHGFIERQKQGKYKKVLHEIM
ncbi:MAG: hypothetical protein K6C30_01365, partial [Bacteroidaceae bacterium]|nr:hypothetical protein [Bacteroidaceae bacterium]